jgi:hypothetical protein
MGRIETSDLKLITSEPMGNASSHASIVPMLLRLVPRLQSAFPRVKIKLRGDAGFALPLLYEFCEFFAIEYAIGIPANCVFQQRAEPLQKQLKRRYRRSTKVPQRSFSSFRHRARSWRRQVFAFYNDRGECENRIEEFKNGFRADRLSCHRFLANAFRLLLHGAAYNLVNFFRQHSPIAPATRSNPCECRSGSACARTPLRRNCPNAKPSPPR